MRSMVEGVRGSVFDHCHRGPYNPVGHLIERGQGFGGGDPHHSYALRFEPRVPAPITFRPVLQVVTRAVDLDGEPGLGAVKVEHIGSDRMLPSKRGRSGCASPKPAPQHGFRRREIAA